MRRYALYALIPFIFALDRWTKLLVSEKLFYLEEIKITGFFSIVHARNLGGVFGILNNYEYAKFLFTVFPVLIACFLLYLLFRYRFSIARTLALTLIFAGALGNIYDRIAYGYVVDFLDFYYKSYHWPAFNVADISITCGILLWICAEFFVKTEKKGTIA